MHDCAQPCGLAIERRIGARQNIHRHRDKHVEQAELWHGPRDSRKEDAARSDSLARGALRGEIEDGGGERFDGAASAGALLSAAARPSASLSAVAWKALSRILAAVIVPLSAAPVTAQETAGTSDPGSMALRIAKVACFSTAAQARHFPFPQGVDERQSIAQKNRLPCKRACS